MDGSKVGGSKFLLLLTVILLGLATLDTVKTAKFVRNAAHTTGTIVASKQCWSSSRHGGHYYTSYLIDFNTEQGQDETFYTTEPGLFAGTAGYHIGAPVEVAYDPKDPADVHPASRNLWQTPIFLSVIALLSAAVWFSTYKAATSRQQKSAVRPVGVGTRP